MLETVALVKREKDRQTQQKMIQLKGAKSENSERYARALGMGKGSKGDAQLARAMMGMGAAPKEDEKEAPSIQTKTESRPLEPEAPKDEDPAFDSDLELEDDDEIMVKIRAKREAEMKAAFAQNDQRRQKGHGLYREIKEDEFLPSVTKSYNCVVHFYHNDFARCKVVDKHLSVIAQKHHECKFVHLNAEKSPFFVQKLQITTLPTIVYFKNGIAVDRSVGFEDFGMRDNFKTEVLEKIIRKLGLIPKMDDDSSDDEEEKERRYNPIRLTEEI